MRTETAGVVASPPLIFLTFMACSLAIHRYYPWSSGLAGPLRQTLAVVMIAGGLTLVILATRLFRGAATTIRPWKPSTALVLTGPYRWTRNPMYLAMTLIYTAISLLVDSLWPILFLPALLQTMNWGVIQREERYLERLFGEEYRAYRERVRRWL